MTLDYALVTPARNEATNLRRLSDCVIRQTHLPSAWLIVDNGSGDDTADVANQLAEGHDWVRLIEAPGEESQERGAPVVRAVLAGLAALEPWPDIVVKLDADVSFEPDHFERLIAEFRTDPELGIASGLCLEEEEGRWKPRYSTRSHVRGAVRAYRRRCLEDVMPLEQRMGWDGIDELKAAVHGWKTATIPDIEFFHHRRVGQRERSSQMWLRQGEMAHYMGYRPSYLALRALYRALSDPAALMMVVGYVRAALRREPRYPDANVRALLRREQSLRRLPRRIREARGLG